eukprot:GCRY01002426.1.p1 GENE.GCRY01002426.1~~GCRY01002426.1.p1  ORF type:complete len:426 (+),score=15.50 GCRY01002426.1:237-1514(+)
MNSEESDGVSNAFTLTFSPIEPLTAGESATGEVVLDVSSKLFVSALLFQLNIEEKVTAKFLESPANKVKKSGDECFVSDPKVSQEIKNHHRFSDDIIKVGEYLEPGKHCFSFNLSSPVHGEASYFVTGLEIPFSERRTTVSCELQYIIQASLIFWEFDDSSNNKHEQCYKTSQQVQFLGSQRTVREPVVKGVHFKHKSNKGMTSLRLRLPENVLELGSRSRIFADYVCNTVFPPLEVIIDFVRRVEINANFTDYCPDFKMEHFCCTETSFAHYVFPAQPAFSEPCSIAGEISIPSGLAPTIKSHMVHLNYFAKVSVVFPSDTVFLEEEIILLAPQKLQLRNGLSMNILNLPPFGCRWVPDSEVQSCKKCEAKFSLTNRRHHCRRCGQVFCGACSAKVVELAEMGFDKAVRVCDICYVTVANMIMT